MTKLIIKREKKYIGMALKMECYVNEQLICQLKNGEQKEMHIEADGAVIFKCRLPYNPMSIPITIQTINRPAIYITVKQGMYRPEVTVIGSTHTRLAGNTVIYSTEQDFIPTKKVGMYLGIDENARKWAIPKGFSPSFAKATIYDYKDIVDFELLEDGTSIVKGGLGRAAVGGLLFRGTGAIVGGTTGPKMTHAICSRLCIKITVNRIANPIEYISLISTKTSKDCMAYRTAYQNAQEILSLLQIICNDVEQNRTRENIMRNNTDNGNKTLFSAPDEIRKYKQLMDDGIITEEEFTLKKKQLLGL